MPPRRPPQLSGAEARQARIDAGERFRSALIGEDDENMAATIERLGGTRAVANLVGRSMRQVQRWARGETRAPRADAAGRLRTADVQDRLTRRGFVVDPATGQPLRPVRVQLRGQASVRAGGSETYSYYRAVGSGAGGPELQPGTFSSMVDALGRGDNEGLVRAYERDMTENYISMPETESYDPTTGTGWRQESVDDVAFFHEFGGGNDRLF